MKNRIARRIVITLVACLVCVLSLGVLSSCSSVRDQLASRLSAQSQTGLSEGLVRTPKVAQQTENLSSSDASVTVLVYMNGSNLESEDGEATDDITEMVNAGTSNNVNVIVETLGTSSWSRKYGIASDRSQIYKVNGTGLDLVNDNLGQCDCTDPATLRDFISWGTANYPADRYILIMWDHGGGPVYGFGYDEWQDEDATLTLDEMQSAISEAGTYFDFIGMDCCIMSSIEVCAALYDYCDYTILSEDFESNLGWAYTDWLKELYSDPTETTPLLGATIVDKTVEANNSDREYGDNTILAVIDESMIKVLFSAWTDFAYANEDALLNTNYSTQVQKSERALPRMRPIGQYSDWMDAIYGDYIDNENVSMQDYYVTDIMAVASTIESDESKALSAALKQAIVYMNATSGDSELTGLSVTLPYGDSEFYQELNYVFTRAGFDKSYVTWLAKFVDAAGTDNYYDYDRWDDSWNGWGSVDDDDFDWGYFEKYGDDDFWDSFLWGSSGREESENPGGPGIQFMR